MMTAQTARSAWPAFLLPLLFLLGTTSPAQAVDFMVLTEHKGSVTSPSDPPLTETKAIVQEIMRRVGQQGEITSLPWARAYEMALHTPNVVLFSTTRTRERDKLFHWIGPILRVKWIFLARKGSGIVINSLDDARKVGAIGTYVDDVRDRFLRDRGFTNLDRCSSSSINYRKLLYGRVDLIVSTNFGLDMADNAQGIDFSRLEEVYTLKEADTYVAISKNSDPATVKAWQDAFQAMRKDGTFQRLFRQWHPDEAPPMDERRPWLEE